MAVTPTITREYEVEVTIRADGEVVPTRTERIGVRLNIQAYSPAERAARAAVYLARLREGMRDGE